MANDTVKTALDKLMALRKPTLEGVATAHGKRDKLQAKRAEVNQELKDVEAEIRAAHDAAIEAGWSPSELRKIGFRAPRRSTKTQTKSQNQRPNREDHSVPGPIPGSAP